MAKKNISQKFRLKNIDETRNYLIEEINQSGLISKKCKRICTTLNYIEHFLILVLKEYKEMKEEIKNLKT